MAEHCKLTDLTDALPQTSMEMIVDHGLEAGLLTNREGKTDAQYKAAARKFYKKFFKILNTPEESD